MKILTLTYHFAINYGAILQCYALQKALNDLKYDSQVLNYINFNQKKNNSLYKQNKGVKRLIKNILYFPYHKEREHKYLLFKMFLENNITLTKEITNISSLEKFLNQGSGIIFVGSDQVWNPNIDDFSESFFVPIKTNYYKATYGASIGSADSSQLDKYGREIASFDKISVRENKSINILKKYTSKNISIVPDPVFLINKNEWISLIKNNQREHKNKYILCYFLNNKNMRSYYKIVRKIASKMNLKIICISGGISPLYYKKNTIRNAGPIEFLDLFYNANYVFTDSFHGTVFSIIFEKQFFSFDSSSAIKDSRKKGILERCSLLDRYVTLDNLSTLDNYKKMINYSLISPKIEKIKIEGLNFIENTIKETKNL